MRHPKKENRRRQQFMAKQEMEDELIPEYFIPQRNGFLVTGKWFFNLTEQILYFLGIGSRAAAIRIGRNSGHHMRREEYRLARVRNSNQTHRDYMKHKLKLKAMDDRSSFTRNLFSTEKGKSLIDAIKNKVKNTEIKDDKDKDKLGKYLLSESKRLCAKHTFFEWIYSSLIQLTLKI